MRSTLCFLFSLEAAGSFLTSPRHHAAAKGSRSCPSAFWQGQDRPGNIFGLPWHRKPAIALVDGRTAPTDRSRQLPSCRASVLGCYPSALPREQGKYQPRFLSATASFAWKCIYHRENCFHSSVETTIPGDDTGRECEARPGRHPEVLPSSSERAAHIAHGETFPFEMRRPPRNVRATA